LLIDAEALEPPPENVGKVLIGNSFTWVED
jgi:hypothetical protein